MKKFLLFIACVFCLSAASAGTVSISTSDWSTLFTTDGTDFVATKDGYTISLLKNTSSTALIAPSSTDLRVYVGAQLKIEAPAGQMMTDIKFTVAKSSKASSNSDLTLSTGWNFNGSVSTTANSTFNTVSDGDDTFVMTASKQLRLSAIEITYSESEVPTVARPVITFDEATSEVTITCETEGAEIRYTDNEAALAPESWTLYESPFTVSESTTIYAVAFKDGNASSKAQLAIVVPVYYTSIADILAKAANNEVIDYKGELTFVYANGQYAYVTDGKDYMLLYGNNATVAEWENGQKFDGFSGKYTVYNGLPEIAAGYTIGTAGEKGEAVMPTTMNINDLTSADLNRYVEFVNMSVEGDNLLIEDEEGSTLKLYQRFGVDIPTGTGYTVTGFYSVFKTDYQLYPVAFKAGNDDAEPVAPVFTPAGGTIKRATEVTIDGKGFEVMYSFDYDEADVEAAEWIEYTGPFTIDDTCVITAYTYNSKGDKSEYVKAEFYYDGEIVPPEGGDYTFDFTTPSELIPAVETPETVSSGTLIAGTVFESEPAAVTVCFTAAEGANESQTPKLWLTKNGTEARFFKGSTLTVAAEEGYQLTKIEFIGGGISNLELYGDAAGSYIDGIWTASTVADQSEVETSAVKSVTFIGNQSSGGKIITSIKVLYDVDTTTGIENVSAEENGVAEYYNLQGVRVANPTAGKLYIKRQGNKVTKVIM